MRRRARSAALLAVLVGLLVSGCPGYGDGESCVRDAQCASGFVCDTVAGSCVRTSTVECSHPRHCDATETCASDGTCRVGDCTWPDIGCVEGFSCTPDQGVWACRIEDGAGGASAGGAGGDSPGGMGGELTGGAAGDGAGGTSGGEGGAPPEGGTSGAVAGGTAGIANVAGTGGGGTAGIANVAGTGGGGTAGIANVAGTAGGGTAGVANVAGTGGGGTANVAGAGGVESAAGAGGAT